MPRSWGVPTESACLAAGLAEIRLDLRLSIGKRRVFDRESAAAANDVVTRSLYFSLTYVGVRRYGRAHFPFGWLVGV